MHPLWKRLLGIIGVLGAVTLEQVARGQGALPQSVATRALPAGLSALAGSYLIVPESSDSVIPPIHVAAQPFNLFVRGLALNRLNLVNPPVTSVNILVPNARTVVVGTDGWPAFTLQLNGTATRWQRNAVEWYDVSAHYSVGGLQQRFVGAEGERVNRYTVSRDHRLLRMEVLVASKELAAPVRYTLTFVRL